MSEPTPGMTYPANVLDRGDQEELEPGRFYVVPEGIPVKVQFTIPAGSSGWRSWIGSFKPQAGRPYQWVGLSVINVTNVVTHGCTNHTQSSPVVGPTVDDLATALAELEPFEVTTEPTPVTIYGHSGTYLALTVPPMETKVRGDTLAFTDCMDEQLKSWIGAPLSYGFWGYTGPGMVEELWVLDVDGRRLLISANYRPDSPPQDVAELRSILDSIEIVADPG